MAIEKLTVDEIKELTNYCPALNKIKDYHGTAFGEYVNEIIDCANEQREATMGLDEIEQKCLNQMCNFNGVKLGDLISNLLILTHGEGSLSLLKQNQIKALNNICPALRGKKIGEKLNEALIVLNENIMYDYNEDRELNDEDVEYLQDHVMSPEDYPIPEGKDADVNKDGIVDSDDTLALQDIIDNR